MIERRPFQDLGGANHGWLDAKHHFSFAGYHDPARMGWGALRVWKGRRSIMVFSCCVVCCDG